MGVVTGQAIAVRRAALERRGNLTRPKTTGSATRQQWFDCVSDEASNALLKAQRIERKIEDSLFCTPTVTAPPDPAGGTNRGINRINPAPTEGGFWEVVGGLFYMCYRVAMLLFSTGNRPVGACGKPAADLPQLVGKLSATCFHLGLHPSSTA